MITSLRRGLVGAAVVLAACAGGTGATTTTASPTSPTTAPDPSPSPPPVSTAPQQRTVEVTVRDGAVEGGPRRERFRVNEQATIRVRSDVSDEVHLHGYDQRVDVEAGGTTTLEFVASIPGVFEMELEHRRLKLLELEVRP